MAEQTSKLPDEQPAVSGQPMETNESEETNRGEKRPRVIYIDPDDETEISSAKKPRVEPNKAMKSSVLKYIIRSYNNLGIAFGACDHSSNIDVSTQLTNILFTCHTILRQRANKDTPQNTEKKTADKDFTINLPEAKTASRRREECLDIVKASAEQESLIFKRFDKDDKTNWLGVAGPYLNFFTGFSLRYKELRMGHVNMPHSKDGEKSKVVPVTKYGLYGCHHILLEGCTFPPEKRSSMSQSMGPMTSLLCYLRAKGDYAKKWREAAKRAMAALPYIDEALSAMKDKTCAEIAPLITTMADTLNIITGRQSHRVFFPLCMVLKIILDAEGKIDEVLLTQLVEGINMSGRGAFYAYKLMCSSQFKMSTKFGQSEAAQVVFHSMFGTYKEDLGVLTQITNNALWKTREELGKGFQKKATEGTLKIFNLIKFQKYSKLCSANQSGLLTTAYTQTSSLPVFSGSRVAHFTDDFFESITRRAKVTTGGKTLEQVKEVATATLTSLMKELEKRDRKLEMGTVEWRDVEGLSFDADGPVTPGFVVHTTGNFFLGKKKD